MNATKVVAVAVVVLGSMLALAQAPPPQGPGGPLGGRGGRGGRGGGQQQNCMAQAGISRDAMQRAQQIREEAQSQIRAVCADSNLTDQEKRDKIRSIHEDTRQQVENLITPAQEQQIQQCRQQQRGGGGGGRSGGGRGQGQGGGQGGGGARGQGGGNPCARMQQAPPATGTVDTQPAPSSNDDDGK